MADYQPQDESPKDDAPSEGLSFFLRTKEQRRQWREQEKKLRKERLSALREQYRNAPIPTKIWHLYLKWHIVHVAALALAVCLCVYFVPKCYEAAQKLWFDTTYGSRDNPVSKEEIYALSPIDEEGAARIAALDPVDKDDTWTICVYLVGSNLEDYDENDLSAIVRMEASGIVHENDARDSMVTDQLLNHYMSSLSAGGLELPGYLYYPTKPVASSRVVTEDVVVSDSMGAASKDLSEMTSDIWSENINIVVQTGGASHWSNHSINPNRTQRFQYKDGVFTEVENLPLQPSSTPETLADFLAFCRDSYPADHTMLVLWNHGAGAFGYGNDSICGGMFTLKDIRAALDSVYDPNPDAPAFDIIGFDACLMSSLEVAHALDGFARYYAVSEELEPNDGWDYGPWLQAMTDDPTMSPARVAQAIADAYMDFYMTENANIGFLVKNDATFTVLDARKASELYDAYCDLAKAQLIDASQDLSVLSEMGRCADKSTHFAGSMATTYNTIDLGNYVSYTVDSYPEQSSRIAELLDETVLYHRASGSLSDSEGITIYLPGNVDSIQSLMLALKYSGTVSEDQNIQALYFYKVAGLLDDEMAAYVTELTGSEPKKLDTTPFKNFSKTVPVLDEDTSSSITDTDFTIAIDNTLLDALQSYSLELGQYDAATKTVTYYGHDEYVLLEEDDMRIAYDGKWVCFDGVPLSVEVVSLSPSTAEYRSKVMVGDTPKYLEFSYDRDTEALTMTGIRTFPSTLGQGTIIDANSFLNTRTVETLELGTIIKPVYTVSNLTTNTTEEVVGQEIMVKVTSDLELKSLPSGTYLGTALITDQRGDEYYSQVMCYEMSNGHIADAYVDPSFRGSSW